MASVLADPDGTLGRIEVTALKDDTVVYGAMTYLQIRAQILISCYSGIEIELFADSVAISFQKTDKSKLCETLSPKTLKFGAFANQNYISGQIVRQLTVLDVKSPIILENLTPDDLLVFANAAEAGFTVHFSDGRTDKCITDANSVYSMDLTAFYSASNITLGVSCVVGLLVAALNVYLGVLCSRAQLHKKAIAVDNIDDI